MAPKKPRKKKEAVCSECIEIFPWKELRLVLLDSGLGGKYYTIFCDPCIKERGFDPERVGKVDYGTHCEEFIKKNNPWKKK